MTWKISTFCKWCQPERQFREAPAIGRSSPGLLRTPSPRPPAAPPPRLHHVSCQNKPSPEGEGTAEAEPSAWETTATNPKHQLQPGPPRPRPSPAPARPRVRVGGGGGGGGPSAGTQAVGSRSRSGRWHRPSQKPNRGEAVPCASGPRRPRPPGAGTPLSRGAAIRAQAIGMTEASVSMLAE
nr:basic proline-rich protein [Oryctolagus cuniculus]